MIWPWLVLAALLLLLPLLIPVRLEFKYQPLELTLRWVGLRLDWSDDRGGRFRLFLLTFRFSEPKPTQPEKGGKDKCQPQEESVPKAQGSETKKKRKQKKSKPPFFREPSFEMLKKTWRAPCFRRLLKTVKAFLWRLRRSVRLERVEGRIGNLDFYQSGVLAGFLAAIPDPRLRIQASFLEENWVWIGLRIYLWRIIASLLWWGLRFPYRSLWQLYKLWLHPARAK